MFDCNTNALLYLFLYIFLQKEVTQKSIKIGEEEVQCQRLADIAQADLDEAMPALDEAVRALDALSKKDISEMKSYGKPPVKVEMVMEAVMILKGVIFISLI